MGDRHTDVLGAHSPEFEVVSTLYRVCIPMELHVVVVVVVILSSSSSNNDNKYMTVD